MSDPGLNVVVERILAGTAAPPLRAAAARGALPLPREVLVRLQVHLLADADASVRDVASVSLQGIDADGLRAVLSEPTCAPEVLAHFATRAARDESIAERIAFHEAQLAGIDSCSDEGVTAGVRFVLGMGRAYSSAMAAYLAAEGDALIDQLRKPRDSAV